MLKKFNKLSNIYSFMRNFSVISGVFVIEVIFLINFFLDDIKNIIFKLNNLGTLTLGFVFIFESLIIFLILRKKVKLHLRFRIIQYLLLIEIISYFIVYTVNLIVINAGISWYIGKFGIFVLSLILDFIVAIWAQDVSKNNIISIMILLLSIICILLISSLSVTISIDGSTKYNILYLVSSLIVFIPLFLIIFFCKEININNYLIKWVQNKVIDIFISFIFLIAFLLLITAILVEIVNDSDLYKLLSDWIPILSISIAMGWVGLLYTEKLKILISKVYRHYFLFWIVVPPILFILYLRRSSFGNYTTFKALLGIILAIDAVALLTFGEYMKVLLPKFEKERKLIPKYGSKYDIAELKLTLSNITIVTTFLNTIFPNETTVENCINNAANICYKIGNMINRYLGENNIDAIFSKQLLNDTQFKMIIFMFVVVGLLLLFSRFLFKIEKYLYIKISFR